MQWGVRLVVCLVACGPVLAAPPRPEAEVSPAARKVLEKALEAIGGEKAVGEIRGARFTTKGTYKMGPMEAPYTSEFFHVFPDKLLFKLDAGMFKASAGADGKVAWSQMQSPPARLKGAAKEAILDWGLFTQMLLVRPLLHTEGLEISGGESSTEAGKTIHKIRIRHSGGRKLTVVFSGGDKPVLVSAEGDVLHLDGKKGTFRATYAKSKAFGSITLPSVTTTESFVDGKIRESMTEEITAIEWNPEVPSSAFQPPKLDEKLLRPGTKEAPAFQGLRRIHRGSYDSMGETIGALHETSEKSGLIPNGAIVAFFLNDPGEVAEPSELRTELVLPVVNMTGTSPSLPAGTTLKDFPAVTVAHLGARGPYGEADVRALRKVMEWIPQEGHEITGPPRILYHHNPEQFVATDLVSEVQVPVKKK